jgi:hypothetical protein
MAVPGQRGLADEHLAARVGVGQLAHLPDVVVGAGVLVADAVGELVPGRGVVVEGVVLADAVDHVDPEAVDAPVEPEAHDLLHALDHARVLPVEVGLLGQEQVQVPLSRRLVEGPGRPVGERRLPVVRGAAVGGGVPPDVEPPVGIVPARSGGHEPRVLVRGVVRDEVEDDPQAELTGLGDERIGRREVPEERVDVAVVGHVVAEVGHGGPVERREPHRIDAQPHQVVEVGADPVEVADAVAARVGERARVDLVDDAGHPPGQLVRGGGGRGEGIGGRRGHRTNGSHREVRAPRQATAPRRRCATPGDPRYGDGSPQPPASRREPS